jgi:hypothetical protein
LGPKSFSQVQNKNTKALFKVAILALQHNRIGFAKIFLQKAANADSIQAKNCLTILRNRHLPIRVRIGTILTK